MQLSGASVASVRWGGTWPVHSPAPALGGPLPSSRGKGERKAKGHSWPGHASMLALPLPLRLRLHAGRGANHRRVPGVGLGLGVGLEMGMGLGTRVRTRASADAVTAAPVATQDQKKTTQAPPASSSARGGREADRDREGDAEGLGVLDRHHHQGRGKGHRHGWPHAPSHSHDAPNGRATAQAPAPATLSGTAPVSVSADRGRGKAQVGSSSGSSERAGAGASSVASGVRLEGVRKAFKGVELLRDVNWEVKKGERVGLVGVNGAGKTTQLKIITGEMEPDEGVVLKARPNMKISYLTQEFEVVPSRTVREELLSAFGEQMAVQARLEEVQAALERATEDMDLMATLLDELDTLQKQAESVDLYDVDVKINKLLPELGLSPQDCDRLVASFSGGWQMRMSLGKILLQEPDLLLLDEPTNHLDLDAIEWLEKYLKKQDVPMVVVSHDRAFLDQLCTKIVETDRGISMTFQGNYSAYVAQKAEWEEAQRMAWERQQKDIARTEDMIQRLSGGGNAGRASSAEKKLERMQETGALLEKPFERKQMRFRFPELERSGREVVQIAGLSHSFEGKVLFEKARLQILRGEKVAFIGPNGCGKSTLLRFIMGFTEPQHGDVALGEHRVVANYFEQNQAEALDLDKTVLQTVEEAAEGWRMSDIKALLGRCNFKGDTAHRKVSFLSGGEKARLALCKFMVTPATLLVLDEPTNHLDIPTKEMLEEALRDFRGTVIAVSHDRYFLRQIVNRVVEVKDHRLQDYSGDYNYYLEKNLEARKRELERESELEAVASPGPKAKSKMSKAEKELQKKQKAQAFGQKQAKSKASKNAKRWG